MNNILRWLAAAEDRRQPWKIKHLMRDIIAIVFFASLANADDWMSIELFAIINEKFLRKYLQLPNGIPSHDTIQRVFAALSPDYLQEFRQRWDQVMSGSTGNRIERLLGIDGKTQRGNGTSTQKANHIVSAVDERGFCVGEVRVDEKSNEITAIPKLLHVINIKGHIVTIDAMGCQTVIAALIIKKGADYVLALKGNQGSLYEDVKQYFADPGLLLGCPYVKSLEKARSNIEKREYWQTDDISWLSQKPDWAGIRSIAMTRNTITKSDGTVSVEERYYISSLSLNVETVAWAIRGHWMVESYHWHLDVTFREDANLTLERDSAYNLNIMKKMAINTLKLIDVGIKKKVSLRGKRLMISWDFEKYFDTIMGI
jgi:predicted transposase YbfD/YdcC